MNPLAIETAIVDALRAALPGTTVTSAANVFGSVDLARLLPAVIVVPGPTEPLDDGTDTAFSESQNWQIDVAVLSAPDHQNLTKNFQPAGELIGQTIAVLAGLDIGAPYQRLAYRGRGEPEYLTGRVHFPLLFTVVYAANPEAA